MEVGVLRTIAYLNNLFHHHGQRHPFVFPSSPLAGDRGPCVGDDPLVDDRDPCAHDGPLVSDPFRDG